MRPTVSCEPQGEPSSPVRRSGRPACAAALQAVAALAAFGSSAVWALDLPDADHRVEAAPAAPAARGDAVRGQALYEQRCSACHSPQADRVGPHHNGVFGRRAGGVAGFAYSRALSRAQLVWDESTLNAWLRDPEALLPGQQMGYSVPEAVDRADLVAYLRSLTGQSEHPQ